MAAWISEPHRTLPAVRVQVHTTSHPNGVAGEPAAAVAAVVAVAAQVVAVFAVQVVAPLGVEAEGVGERCALRLAEARRVSECRVAGTRDDGAGRVSPPGYVPLLVEAVVDRRPLFTSNRSGSVTGETTVPVADRRRRPG